jgi:hypothetical protein
MHRFALAVLGNSPDAMACANELSTVLAKSISTQDLLVGLVSELKHAEDRLHDAFYAAKALKALVGVSAIRVQAVELGLSTALATAHNEGVSRHALLAEESRQLQVQLGGECK